MFIKVLTYLLTYLLKLPMYVAYFVTAKL